MVRMKITYYKMLTSKRRAEIDEKIRARQAERVARRVARIAAGLPPDSPEPEEEDEQEGEEEKEQQRMEVEVPDQQVSGFTMEQALEQYALTQSDDLAEQSAILESIQDEASVSANRALLRRRQAETDALFASLDELDAKYEAEEGGAEQPEGQELQLPPLPPPECAEILVVSDDE
jgi:hypothetical protein